MSAEQKELDPRDVWKDFHCPKYVTPVCPETDKIPKDVFEPWEQSTVVANYALLKLCELICDPVTSNSAPRICRLLYEYLHETGDNGYKLKDLPMIIKILKFLAQNVQEFKEYEPHLERMLDLCNLPPLLDRSSEAATNSDILKQYFTLLGHLLLILPTKVEVLKIHKALNSLLLGTKSIDIAAVKHEYCCRAMEKSNLPITLTELLSASLLDMYGKVLELVLLLSSISHTCSHRMMQAGVLNTIFTRMDLPFATQLRCTRPPDSLLNGIEYCGDMTFLIMTTVWSLLKSVLPPNNMPVSLKETVTCACCGLWYISHMRKAVVGKLICQERQISTVQRLRFLLRIKFLKLKLYRGLAYAFERQVHRGQYRSNCLRIRNEMAVVILAVIILFPSWNFVSSGIADEAIRFLVGVEAGSVRVFSEKVKFGRSNADLFFQKTLLVIAMHLVQIDACIYLMVKRKVMRTVLQLVNPNVEGSKITWSTSQFWSLWTYAINALAILAPKMPHEFIKYNGCIRMVSLLEWSSCTKFDTETVLHCVKAICTILLNDDTFLLSNFRRHGLILSLIRLINQILSFNKVTMKQQRILTSALISIERLIKKLQFYREMYGEHSITFTLELLFRCLYRKDEETQIDQRLLLALGSYIWESIVHCPKNLEKFIEYGAVYIILDVIEISPYPSQCLFLALLTDICDNYFCGPYLCTWRGVNKRTGLMSLLATIWREEEIRIKVKRCKDGAVTDEELSEIGTKQWSETYDSKLSGNISPALVDMIGSVRPKIYSIRKIIERDGERYEMAKDRYKILYSDLPVEDRITICSIDLYFTLKLGQVWVEIDKYFEQVGITPLGMDGQAIFIMAQRYHFWGVMIKERQTRLKQFVKREEDVEEIDEYARIRDSKLASALDAFDELDYIHRTTNREYMVKRKNDQRQQVDSALKFPPGLDDSHCHRTFQDNVHFTAIFDQHLSISSGPMLIDQMNLPLVSPCDSHISDDTYSSEICCSPLSSKFLLKQKEFNRKP